MILDKIAGGKEQIKRVILMIKLVAPLICILSMLTFVGCSKVTKENYDKIKIGMSFEEVVGVLGKPDTCEEPVMTMKSCMWASSDKQIEIKFAGDIVAWRSSKGI